MQITSKNIWPTQIWECKLSLDQKFNLNLWEDICKINTSSASTDFNLFEHQGQYIQTLKEKLIETANVVLFDLDKEIKSISRGWVNFNSVGASAQPHSHFVNLVGVYYISSPENGGDLCLIDPSPGTRISGKDKTGNTGYFIKPTSSTLVLFPGLINHFVTQNNSNEPRISVAINFVIGDKHGENYEHNNKDISS